MNQQLSIYDYLIKPKNKKIRQDLLVSILTPAGISQDLLPATAWLKYRDRHDFGRKKLFHDGAGHTYVVQKVFKHHQNFTVEPIQLYGDQKTLIDYLKPTVDSIMNQLEKEANERNYHAN
ncbi:hypothetical protein [Fructobacillus fructosus]|uniref:Uncharacterized protein n=3 Tax=Fructobacillus fructosus TaxID=1631 RepID=A0ABM9MP19_9LACO|nr:hypothetical protein [Fructobacillus fructosus]MBC9118386.1 hypothetical protein [Fructobacillus fructosus]MBD9364607.1 hypothetical protein [Leuconostoc mesenteroides]CAK1229879.1 unnamed protein product [Fructobacillus fructosus]